MKVGCDTHVASDPHLQTFPVVSLMLSRGTRKKTTILRTWKDEKHLRVPTTVDMLKEIEFTRLSIQFASPDPRSEQLERVLDVDKVEGQETRLLVKWAGSSYSSCTYELVSDLDNAGLVSRYVGRCRGKGMGLQYVVHWSTRRSTPELPLLGGSSARASNTRKGVFFVLFC